jgi:hypothetical protein
MAPFKVLYGRRCRTPLNWIESGEKVIFAPDLVEEAEATVRCIQHNLKAAKSHEKTYANKRRQSLEFEVGDHVYLRVSPMKGVKRFGVKGKLVPHLLKWFYDTSTGAAIGAAHYGSFVGKAFSLSDC